MSRQPPRLQKASQEARGTCRMASNCLRLASSSLTVPASRALFFASWCPHRARKSSAPSVGVGGGASPTSGTSPEHETSPGEHPRDVGPGLSALCPPPHPQGLLQIGGRGLRHETTCRPLSEESLSGFAQYPKSQKDQYSRPKSVRPSTKQNAPNNLLGLLGS
jgi:hypothetical protein